MPASKAEESTDGKTQEASVLGEGCAGRPGPQPGQRPLRWRGTPNPLAQGAGLGSARVCASSRVLALSCSPAGEYPVSLLQALGVLAGGQGPLLNHLG